MRKEDIQVLVLERFADVQPFLEEVTYWADSEKNALGFLAAKVFNEFAHKGNLLVAVTLRDGQLVYAGHLLFDARHAKATVLQVFVKPGARRHGAARRLLQRLKEHLTGLHFISIYAGVAEDLRDANAFWERNGFYIQRTRPGGKTRNRTILVRCHELGSPQLFERSGIGSSDLFGLQVGLEESKPIYLLDLNVLFDLGPRRPRNAAALDLFRSERRGACQLALSAELNDELARTTAKAPRTDPMQSWAAIFITFPLPPDADKAQLVDALGKLIFPDRARDGSFTANDRSDLTHLATAVHHRLTGFITSDEAILAAGKEIEAVFKIHVISPQAFQPSDELVGREELFEVPGAGGPLLASPLTAGGQEQLRQMLLRLGVSDSDVVSRWGALDSVERVFQRSVVLADERLTGYLAYQRQVDASTITGLLAVDEAYAEGRDTGRLLLNKLLSLARDMAPSRVLLQLAPKQVAAREISSGLGFAGAYLKPTGMIDQAEFDPSVLSPETLSSIGRSQAKTVTAFDNVIVLPKPVPLCSLKNFGCGEPTQLITTRPITSEQLTKILDEALSQ